MSDELDLVGLLRSDQPRDEAEVLSRVRSGLMMLIESSGTTDSANGDGVLRQARTVLLIDWHGDVPRSLAAAGYEVYSHYRTTHRARLVPEAPAAIPDGTEVLGPLDDEDRRGFLLWEPAPMPPQVDIVGIYRPAPEQLDLVERFVIPLGAKALWIEEGGFASGMEPPYRGPSQLLDVDRAAEERCAAAGIAVIEGRSLADAARQSTRPTTEPLEVSITPAITYVNALAAIRWLEVTLGFELSALFGDPDGRVRYAQLVWRGGAINVHTADDHPDPASPVVHRTPSLMVAGRDDVDAALARARAVGAEVVREPEESFYGSYGFSVRDPEGHVWSVGTHWLGSDTANALPERLT